MRYYPRCSVFQIVNKPEVNSFISEVQEEDLPELLNSSIILEENHVRTVSSWVFLKLRPELSITLSPLLHPFATPYQTPSTPLLLISFAPTLPPPPPSPPPSLSLSLSLSQSHTHTHTHTPLTSATLLPHLPIIS